MIRRLLRDRDARLSAFIVAAVLSAVIFGYGEVQKRDEQAQYPTLTTQDGGSKTAYAAKE